MQGGVRLVGGARSASTRGVESHLERCFGAWLSLSHLMARPNDIGSSTCPTSPFDQASAPSGVQTSYQQSTSQRVGEIAPLVPNGSARGLRYKERRHGQEA